MTEFTPYLVSLAGLCLFAYFLFDFFNRRKKALVDSSMKAPKLSIVFLIQLLSSFVIIILPILRMQDSEVLERIEPELPKRELISYSGLIKADTVATLISWTGRKPSGTHSGTIKLKSGELKVHAGILTSCLITVDMHSISCTDIEDLSERKDLEEHLMDDDFFSVHLFPTATFEITEVRKGASGYSNTIYGVLKIKGVSQNVSFPAEIKYEKDVLYADAKLIFDRTKFGIKYKSKTIFPELGDKFLFDEIVLDIHLVAPVLPG